MWTTGAVQSGQNISPLCVRARSAVKAHSIRPVSIGIISSSDEEFKIQYNGLQLEMDTLLVRKEVKCSRYRGIRTVSEKFFSP